jgi:integrase
LQGSKPYITNLKNVWAKALQRARVTYFSLYELRHTFATRLSSGGVTDHLGIQMLRQEDAAVVKGYSQAKLNMNQANL